MAEINITLNSKYDCGDVITFSNASRINTCTGVIIDTYYDTDHKLIAYKVLTNDIIESEKGAKALSVAEDNIISGISADDIDTVWTALDQFADKEEEKEN